jgi:hypothetical protein
MVDVLPGAGVTADRIVDWLTAGGRAGIAGRKPSGGVGR